MYTFVIQLYMKGGYNVHSKKNSKYQDEGRRLPVFRDAGKDPTDKY